MRKNCKNYWCRYFCGFNFCELIPNEYYNVRHIFIAKWDTSPYTDFPFNGTFSILKLIFTDCGVVTTNGLQLATMNPLDLAQNSPTDIGNGWWQTIYEAVPLPIGRGLLVIFLTKTVFDEWVNSPFL